MTVEVLVPASLVLSDLVSRSFDGVRGPAGDALERVRTACAAAGYAVRPPVMLAPNGRRSHVPLATVEVLAEDVATIAAAVVPAGRAEERGALERLSALLSVDPRRTERVRDLVRRNTEDKVLTKHGQELYERGVLPLAVALGGDAIGPYGRRVDGAGMPRPRPKVTAREIDAAGLRSDEAYELLVDGLSAGKSWRAEEPNQQPGYGAWASTGPAGTQGGFHERAWAEQHQLDAFLVEPLWVALALVARDVAGVTAHLW